MAFSAVNRRQHLVVGDRLEPSQAGFRLPSLLPVRLIHRAAPSLGGTARGQSRSTAHQRTPRQDGKAARQSTAHRGLLSVPAPGGCRRAGGTYVKVAATIAPAAARIERHPPTSTRISGTSPSDRPESPTIPAIPGHRNPPV